jgi:hypothetical protein
MVQSSMFKVQSGIRLSPLLSSLHKSVVDELSQIHLLELRCRVHKTISQNLQTLERWIGRAGNGGIVLFIAARENPIFGAQVFF